MILGGLSIGRGATDQYVQLMQHAAKTSGETLVKWEAHEPLSGDDRIALAKAADDFDKMVKLKPTSWTAHHGAGSVRCALEQWDEAIPHLKYAVEHPIQNPSKDDTSAMAHAHYLYSQALFFKHDYVDAEQEATAAIEGEHDADYYYARAQARVQMHKIEDAESDLRTAIDIVPNNPRANELLKFISNMK